ncbi:hypothetical protein EV05_0890 [Prochlorococcus sp. MIT 0601]|nr:hypothetical protein EV05_0890 [Prochlorococcus sp. MIT 0601]
MIIFYGIKRQSSLRSPTNIKADFLEIPKAAKYLPKEAPLTIHLNVDPIQFPSYIEAASTQKNSIKANHKATQLRDGLFALAGLDFDNDLSEWIEPRLSLSILETSTEKVDWILALESKSDFNLNDFIENYWRKKSLNETIVNNENYNNITINSGYKQPLGENITQLATALVEDNLILISPNIDVIKNSIDTSIKSVDSQFDDDYLRRQIENLDEGIGMVYASKKGIDEWLGIPLEITSTINYDKLIASFKIDKSDLLIDSIFLLNEKVLPPFENEYQDWKYLINKTKGEVKDIAVINDPFKLINEDNEDPLSKLIGPIFRNYIDKNNNQALRLIADSRKGPFVWLNKENGWVVGTNDAAKESEVNETLLEENYTRTSLSLGSQDIEVWSKMLINNFDTYNKLKTEIPIILYKGNESNWWSKEANALQERSEGEEILLSPQIKRFQELVIKNNYVFHQIFLGSNTAQNELKAWKPWVLFQAFIGHSLQSNLKGVGIAILIPDDNHPQRIHIQGMLAMG